MLKPTWNPAAMAGKLYEGKAAESCQTGLHNPSACQARRSFAGESSREPSDCPPQCFCYLELGHSSRLQATRSIVGDLSSASIMHTLPTSLLVLWAMMMAVGIQWPEAWLSSSWRKHCWPGGFPGQAAAHSLPPCLLSGQQLWEGRGLCPRWLPKLPLWYTSPGPKREGIQVAVTIMHIIVAISSCTYNRNNWHLRKYNG